MPPICCYVRKARCRSTCIVTFLWVKKKEMCVCGMLCMCSVCVFVCLTQTLVSSLQGSSSSGTFGDKRNMSSWQLLSCPLCRTPSSYHSQIGCHPRRCSHSAGGERTLGPARPLSCHLPPPGLPLCRALWECRALLESWSNRGR